MGEATDADLASIGAALSETVVYPLHRLVLGLQHRPDAGLRVCAWDGQFLRHMSPAKARRLAREFADGDAAGALRPVIAGLEKLADRADELAGLAEAEPEGSA